MVAQFHGQLSSQGTTVICSRYQQGTIVAVRKLKAGHLMTDVTQQQVQTLTNLAEPWVAVAPGGAHLRGALPLLPLQMHNRVPLVAS